VAVRPDFLAVGRDPGKRKDLLECPPRVASRDLRCWWRSALGRWARPSSMAVALLTRLEDRRDRAEGRGRRNALVSIGRIESGAEFGHTFHRPQRRRRAAATRPGSKTLCVHGGGGARRAGSAGAGRRKSQIGRRRLREERPMNPGPLLAVHAPVDKRRRSRGHSSWKSPPRSLPACGGPRAGRWLTHRPPQNRSRPQQRSVETCIYSERWDRFDLSAGKTLA